MCWSIEYDIEGDSDLVVDFIGSLVVVSGSIVVDNDSISAEVVEIVITRAVSSFIFLSG